jgi:glycosyltransferase involved in cell wall biosynthesis
LHIVYLSPTGQLGGAETSLREMMAGIRTSCPDWQLTLLLGQDGPLSCIARELGVQVMVVPFPPGLARLSESNRPIGASLLTLLSASPALLKYRRDLKRVLSSMRPDVIHSNGLKMHLLGAGSCPAGASLIWHIHDYVGARKLTRHLVPRFRKACRVAIVNSNSVGNDLRSLAPGLKIVTVYNAVDLERYRPLGSKLDLDALAGLAPAPPETIRVGLVATFATWKGHRIFLDAMARVSTGLPVRGYIVGGPIYNAESSQLSRRDLDEQVQRAGLTGKIGLTGFVSDTSAAMRSLEVVVHASTRPEPFGMVIIEGMASGRAVIASRAGGALELFAEGENALAHTPGDSAELARHIETLSRDRVLREALGKAGRRTAEQFYARERMARELVDVYRNVRDQPAVAPPRRAIESSVTAVGK